MSEAGLSLTRQAPAGADVVLHDPPHSPKQLWRELFNPWESKLPAQFVTAIRSIGMGRTVSEFLDELPDGVLGDGFRNLCLSLSGHANADRFWDALDAVRRFGGGNILGVHSTLEDIRGVLDVFQRVGVTPTVAIRLDKEFFNVRADQRREYCRLLADLAATCDLRIACSGLTARKLARNHREDLPGVSDECESPRSGPLPEAVNAAWRALDPDGRPVAILQRLAETSSGTLAYNALYSDAVVSKARVRQAVGTLADLGLVETFQTESGTHVDLKEAGNRYCDKLEEEVGKQRNLSEFGRVNENGKSNDNAVVNTRAHVGGEDPTHTRHRLAAFHQVAYLSRANHAAATATAPENSIGVTNYPVEPKDDRGEPGWSYDAEEDTLVVSAEYDGPLQYWVCLAHALTDSRTWNTVLTPERLEDGQIGTFLTDHKELLWGSRCLGHLSNDIETGEEYAEALQDARDDLLDLTRKLRHEEYEDEDRFRATITREALGLVGTMTHILDLAGVELVRELRLPEYVRNFDAERRNTVFESLRTGSAIASKYGQNVAYRQLFEDRADKRKAAIVPTVDVDDPFGELIGSWSVVGDFGDSTEQFASDLRAYLTGDEDVHEDAPEFAVRIPVETTDDRRHTSQAVTAMCNAKNLSPTREAVSVCHALVRTPYGVTKSLSQLGGEDDGGEYDGRPIRSSDVRYALAHLDADRLLRGVSATPRKALAALLRATEPLTQSELADAAGVSTRSLRDHLPALVEMGLARETGGGYRLALSFNTPEERGENVLPTYVRGGGHSPAVHKAHLALRWGREYHDAKDADTPPPEHDWESSDRVRVDLRALSDPWAWIDDLLPALWAVGERDCYADEFRTPGMAAEFGKTPSHTTLQEAVA